MEGNSCAVISVQVPKFRDYGAGIWAQGGRKPEHAKRSSASAMLGKWVWCLMSLPSFCPSRHQAISAIHPNVKLNCYLVFMMKCKYLLLERDFCSLRSMCQGRAFKII